MKRVLLLFAVLGCFACGRATDVVAVQDEDSGVPVEAVDAGPGDAGDAGTDSGWDAGCTPQCDGRRCGPDGCGGSCGQCGQGERCGDDGACVCAAEDDATFCSRNGRRCGPLSGTDNCGAPREIAQCGSCASVESCVDGACRLCHQESDSELCEAFFMNCDTPTLVDSCGVPRSPNCGTCAGAEACQATNVCGDGTTPTNDSCAHPRRLAFDENGVATVSGDTTTAADDTSLPCGGTGSDLVYAFVLTGPKNVTVSLVPDAALQASVAVRSACDDRATQLFGACSAGPEAGASSAIALRAVPAGLYFVVVDGAASTTGTFTLTVSTLDSPPPPENDTCAGALELQLIGGVAMVSGDTGAAGNHSSGLCAAMDGGDLVYRLHLESESGVIARVRRDPALVDFHPAVYIRSACDSDADTDQKACATEVDGLATALNPVLPAGDYFVIVDATDGSFGAFTMEVAVQPPATNDTCASPSVIAIDATTGEGTVTSDTIFGQDDVTPSCNWDSFGRDLVYAFTVPVGAPKNLDVVVTPTSGSLLEPVVSLRTTCDSGATDATCVFERSGAPVAIAMTRVPSGTWYLWVDGADGSYGGFTLRVRLTDPGTPPGNDSCTAPALLSVDSTTRSGLIAGTTRDAIDEFSGSCASGGPPQNGGDVVYQFSLPSTTSIEIDVDRATNSAGYRPAIYLRSGCASDASEISCGTESTFGEGRAKMHADNLAAGTYYVVVDGLFGTTGDFTLSALTYDAATNDDCGSATPLTLTGGRGHARANTCTATDGGSSFLCSGWGPDLIYTLTVDDRSDLTAVLTPGRAFRSTLALRSTCSDVMSELLCSGQQVPTQPNTLRVRGVMPGVYYLIVDGTLGDCGVFDLDVELTQPAPYATNDQCSAARDVPIDSAIGVASVAGDTYDGTDGTVGNCQPPSSASGPDLAYHFTLTQAQALDVQVRARPGSTLQPVVYLRRGCEQASTEIDCHYGGNHTARLMIPRVAAGDYYLVVDSQTPADIGAFDLTIRITTPAAPPSNDTCANATQLTIDSVTNKVTVVDDTRAATDDETSFCSSAASPLTGPDVVYQFTLGSAASITATVARYGSNTTFRPAVSIRGGCAAAEEVACAVEEAASGSASVTVSLEPGTYYVVVDGVTSMVLGSAYGQYQLELEQSAAIASDGCGNAETLQFTGGVAHASGDLSTARKSGDGSCYPYSGADMVYRMVLAGESTVAVTVGPAPNTFAYSPVVYLRQGCNDPMSELGCAYQFSATDATTTFNRVPAGEYFVWVDSTSEWALGPFALTVQLSTPTSSAPTNDTCAGVQTLSLDPVTKAVHTTGDTRWAANDYAGTCGTVQTPHSGPDVAYAFTLQRAATVYAVVNADPNSTGFEPALYLRAECASNAANDELACNGPGNVPSASLVRAVPAGTYYLVVDGLKGSAGRFILDVAARELVPVNDSCQRPESINLDASGFGMVAGTTVFASDSGGGPCNGSMAGGQDVVYKLHLVGTKDVTIDLTAGGGLNPMIYLRSSCDDPATQRGCDLRSSPAPIRIAFSRLPAGDYYVWVDSTSGGVSGAGPFTLRVQASDPVSPPAYDTCAGASAFTFDSNGKAHLTGNTIAGMNDYSGQCGSPDSPLDGLDLVYRFTLGSAASVKATLTREANAFNYRPAIYLRSTCSSPAVADELACAVDSGGVAAANASLPTGTYYLIVDGVGGTFGEFTLDVERGPAVAGDTCLTPTWVAPVAGTVAISGTTEGANDSGSGACADPSGPDVVYAFTLAQEQTLDISVGPDAGSSLNPVVYLRQSCSDRSPSNQRVCASAWGGPVWTRIAHLAAGTWYLWVDSASEGGAFSGTLTFSNPLPAPANDACAGAIPLDVSAGGASTTAETWYASDGGGGTCDLATGPDVVYSITTTVDQKLTARVVRDPTTPNFQPVVYVRTSCAQGSDSAELTCARADWGSASAVVNTLPAGTYYIWIDGSQTNSSDTPGKFTLAVTLEAPVSGPANESCANAQELQLTLGSVQVTGSTVGAQNEAAGTCAGMSARSGDVVYKLVTNADQKITAVVAPASPYNPAVYIRDVCGSPLASHELACIASQYSSSAITAMVRAAPPGTYWIWVDGNGFMGAQAAGTFTLTVTLDPPMYPPSNDTCSAPTALTLGSTVTGDTTAANDDYGALTSPRCPTNVAPGQEVVFSYTPRADGVFTVTATPTLNGSPGWDALLWIATGVCGAPASCLDYKDSGSNGDPERLTVNGVAGTTYYIFLEGYYWNSFGPYSLSLQ